MIVKKKGFSETVADIALVVITVASFVVLWAFIDRIEDRHIGDSAADFDAALEEQRQLDGGVFDVAARSDVCPNGFPVLTTWSDASVGAHRTRLDRESPTSDDVFITFDGSVSEAAIAADLNEKNGITDELTGGSMLMFVAGEPQITNENFWLKVPATQFDDAVAADLVDGMVDGAVVRWELVVNRARGCWSINIGN